MDFHNLSVITNEEASSKNTPRALMVGDKGPPALDEDKETYDESDTSISAAIRTDL
jgi:hypothetical protein